MSGTITTDFPQRPSCLSSRSVKALESFFSDGAIISALASYRIRMARRRNEALFLHRITPRRNKLPDHHDLNVFPPRRSWHRFRNENRSGQSGTDLNRIALERAMRKLRYREPQASWAKELKAFIQRIRERVMGETDLTFQKPHIKLAEKPGDRNVYRPIAVFEPEDRVIETITARYLREVLDHVFCDSSYAFRYAGKGKPPLRHHDAVQKIIDVRRRHQKTGLFVAECDIRGFFDSVEHGIAKECFYTALADARKRDRKFAVDHRAIRVLEAYLECYTFTRNVLKQSQPELQQRRPQAEVKWPVKELRKFYADPAAERIGVPQGGALSGILANCVLHRADKELRRLKRIVRPAFTYIRYCDDMILLCPSKQVCGRAFKIYLDALQNLRLSYHKPKKIWHYGPCFWKGKSKDVFFWGPKGQLLVSPWIQFVGYELRYDGLIRVRKKSLKRHFRMLTAQADALLTELNPGRRLHNKNPPSFPVLRKRGRQVEHRLCMRLISKSVGRPAGQGTGNGPHPMCWASGFIKLHKQPIIESTLKALDRHRERQIARVKRCVSTLPVQAAKGQSTVQVFEFYGHPFSYHAQFENRRGQKLISEAGRKDDSEETFR